MYTQLCLGQDSSLAQELETMGKPLAHTTFCMLAIVARVCSKVHYGLDRSKLRVETKEAYIESLLEQLEPVTRKVALTTAKHRHICRKPNIPRPNSPFRRSRRKKPARYGPARSDATGAPR